MNLPRQMFKNKRIYSVKMQQLALELVYSIIMSNECNGGYHVICVTIFAAIFSFLSIVLTLCEFSTKTYLLNQETKLFTEYSRKNFIYKIEYRYSVNNEITRILSIDFNYIELLKQISYNQGAMLTCHIRIDVDLNTSDNNINISSNYSNLIASGTNIGSVASTNVNLSNISGNIEHSQGTICSVSMIFIVILTNFKNRNENNDNENENMKINVNERGMETGGNFAFSDGFLSNTCNSRNQNPNKNKNQQCVRVSSRAVELQVTLFTDRRRQTVDSHVSCLSIVSNLRDSLTGFGRHAIFDESERIITISQHGEEIEVELLARKMFVLVNVLDVCTFQWLHYATIDEAEMLADNIALFLLCYSFIHLQFSDKTRARLFQVLCGMI